jgi:hypothetical protein
MTYSMKTTLICEHSHGVLWEADLLLDGTVIGKVTQEGRGGSDFVWVEQPHRAAWLAHCAALQGGEEEATYRLLCAEDGVEPQSWLEKAL